MGQEEIPHPYGHLQPSPQYREHTNPPFIPLVPPLRTAERGTGGEATLREAVEAAEREAIVAGLRAAAGNRREAAKRLGVSLRTLFYKMDRHRIE
jgi:transcriptional regulator with GAF, ATPase, and Fis domain